MNIGDAVKKTSGKPFQNGMKTAIVQSLGEMIVPKNHTLTGTKTVLCVYLKDCVGPVRADILSVGLAK
jgi:hypothetical protein